ncbi:uncharacterized protein LOC103569927 isoform X2 [Microplitis demolitor]|uniref:uncharacterized protein LOC103569927 isoform X2 n=1 Tax=Microplitis demolitor TaxID=69319 RepID=UPI0004CD2B56|nr:uncharacterized protein LOC103569927 isoform X2 [Microplitis demolitor]
MTGSARLRPVVVAGLILALLAVALRDVQGDDQLDVSEVQCRPYIEKALKDLGTGNVDESSREDDGKEGGDGQEVSNEKVDDGIQDSNEKESGQGSNEQESGEEGKQESGEEGKQESEEEGKQESGEESKQDRDEQESGEQSNTSVDVTESEENKEQADEPEKKEDGSEESTAEVANESSEQNPDDNKDSVEQNTEKPEEEPGQESEEADKGDESKEAVESQEENAEVSETDTEENVEIEKDEILEKSGEVEANAENEIDSNEAKEQENTKEVKSEETGDEVEKSEEVTEEKDKAEESAEAGETVEESKEDEHVEGDLKSEEAKSGEASVEDTKSVEEVAEEVESEEAKVSENEKSDENTAEVETESEGEGRSEEDKRESDEKNEDDAEVSRQKRDVDVDVDEENTEGNEEKSEEVTQDSKEDGKVDEETFPEEDLIQEIEIPDNLRARDHINQILRLDQDNEEKEAAIEKAADVILKELKRLYDTAIQPLETLYKYRDLSNRHFGDPEIFSKPLILFMGPWSGGKSSIINYLLDNEFKTTALRTGAEPSPAYFNIVMHGEEEEVLDGTQLAADWTFSGLQKFGQGLLDRLRGLKLNNKLLEKVNIVEIPGILEIRKQVQRLFPFNDACQWFIDRADIIFLVYDPSKLDVGPETEAILDQLKGREYQTRIVLNKADQVKPEELMRVQGALIWNISPLMSSAEPPVMYSTSLWSMPYEAGAPTRLLYAQERAFLRDLRTAIDKRVEHKIASARRFAVRVRNHAKMVDCYLTTYYNHKSFFGSKKEISDRIIENPQEYHIYEGLSTLTNISRYDLPDPDVYRDFFRLNQLYDFPLLSSTCTYFRGCPINRLDVAIAYDLPELVGKYKKAVEAAIHEENGQPPAS